MTSEPIRDPNTDHLLTPQNSAFIVIDYQPIQVSSIRSMDQKELIFNIVHTAKAAVNYKLPIIHSTVNVATGRNKPPIAPLMEVLGSYPTYDRTSINSWEDVEFKKAVLATGRKKLIMTALWTEACLAFPALDALTKVLRSTLSPTRLAAPRSPRTRPRSAASSKPAASSSPRRNSIPRASTRLESPGNRSGLHGRLPKLGRVQSREGFQGLMTTPFGAHQVRCHVSPWRSLARAATGRREQIARASLPGRG